MRSVCILLQSHYEFDIRVRRKAEALVAAGYSVDVLCLRSSNSQKTYTLEGVNVRTISLSRKRGSLARYGFEYGVFFLWALVSVTVQMAKKRYDVIDVNNLPDFLVFAAIFAKWMGAKVILDMHEITPEFYMSKYGISEDAWLTGLLKYEERVSFEFADHVITINEPILDLLVSRGLSKTKSTIIMNSADEARFNSRLKPCAGANAEDARGKFVMIYHGTLTDVYGLDIAIQAFNMVHSEMPGAEIWILGSGPARDSLRAMAQRLEIDSKVKLIGQVQPADIPAWLNRCDVGILPIRRDVFLDYASPNKLPEFIIAGKAVIISRLKAIQLYFSDEALGYFEPNDPADLAKQMVRLYRDPGVRTRLAARAKQEYEPIRWDVMKRRYLSMMEGLFVAGASKVKGPGVSEATSASR
jgi:glycosyltransferase involved in cell wall biosynthesis